MEDDEEDDDNKKIEILNGKNKLICRCILYTSVYSADVLVYQLLRHKLTRDVSNKSKHIFL